MSCCLADLPCLGVVDLIVATGPLPASVMALTLKMYDVEGFNSDIITDVAFASDTEISRLE